MNGHLDKLIPGSHAKITFALDLLLVAIAFGMATQWHEPVVPTTSFALLLSGLAGWAVATSVLRLYSPYTPRRLFDGVLLALLGAAAVSLGLLVVDRLFLMAPPFHFDVTIFASFLAVGVVGTQVLVLHPTRQSDPRLIDDVLIVGTGSLGVATARELGEAKRATQRRVVGFLRFEGDPAKPRGIDAPVLGMASDLGKVLERRPVAEVYLAERVMNHGPEMQKLVKQLEELGMPFAVPVHSLRFNRARLLSSASGRDGYLHYLNTPTRPVQWAVKRLLDIVLASTGLLVLSPLLLVVAAIIKFTSPGPVLFRQKRVGLHGAEFSFLKFRSMVVNAEQMVDKLLQYNEQTGPAFKMAHDPRVTPIGRFIRKYSIDELPQLVNVLRGDMTLVGPRPPLPREVAQYTPWQRRRLSVRPGLTCDWQVSGRNEIGFDEWMLLDLHYVDHWSLKKDFSLILRTVPVVLFGKGAS